MVKKPDQEEVRQQLNCSSCDSSLLRLLWVKIGPGKIFEINCQCETCGLITTYPFNGIEVPTTELETKQGANYCG